MLVAVEIEALEIQRKAVIDALKLQGYYTEEIKLEGLDDLAGILREANRRADAATKS